MRNDIRLEKHELVKNHEGAGGERIGIRRNKEKEQSYEAGEEGFESSSEQEHSVRASPVKISCSKK